MKGDGNPMQVKICPNCSAENKPESEKCAKCDWSLAEVQASEGRAAQAPSPGPAMPSSAPVRQGSSAGMIIIILIIIAGAAFAGWWFLMRGGGGPEATIDRFVAAVKAGNFEGMKSTLSKSSTSMFAMIPGGEKAAMEGMKRDSSVANIKVIKTTYEGENAIVEVEEVGKKPSGMAGMGGPTELVLIKEDGQWKIDLMATGARAMQKMQEKMKNMPMPGGPGGP